MHDLPRTCPESDQNRAKQCKPQHTSATLTHLRIMRLLISYDLRILWFRFRRQMLYPAELRARRDYFLDSMYLTQFLISTHFGCNWVQLRVFLGRNLKSKPTSVAHSCRNSTSLFTIEYPSVTLFPACPIQKRSKSSGTLFFRKCVTRYLRNPLCQHL